MDPANKPNPAAKEIESHSGDLKDRLKHVKTQEKNPLPTKEDIAKEKEETAKEQSA
ncbi:hypothetical protein G9A89_020420 [Geosiphon pyriformis]|nr:hypothetical protein G9A89_020420 [Geosiphon pyriformis]